jgi:hypothetical protein
MEPLIAGAERIGRTKTTTAQARAIRSYVRTDCNLVISGITYSSIRCGRSGGAFTMRPNLVSLRDLQIGL